MAEDNWDCVDCEDCILQVGDLVVYNQSGALVRGNITDIRRTNDYVARNTEHEPYRQFVVTIDGTSQVRNTRGIYRLREYDRATLDIAIARREYPKGERCGECHGVNGFADDCGWFMGKNSKGVEVALCKMCWDKFGYQTGER